MISGTRQNDITLLYYTAHTLYDKVSDRVRYHLLDVKGDLPLISISHKPLDFGHNICVGEIGQSYSNCYKQILIGALAAKTEYIACCEDDTLYNKEHFEYRPSSFAYNDNMWLLDDNRYWRKVEHKFGMFGCIAPTKLMIKVLSARFAHTPVPVNTRDGQRYWQEPGKFDWQFGIENPPYEIFQTKVPLITFNYFAGLGGKKINHEGEIETEYDLDYWGDCAKLKERFWI